MQAGMAGGTSAYFTYNAKATGLKGIITLPIRQEIEPVASAELDAKGGFNNARVEKFRLEHFVSFDSSSVAVTGAYSRDDGAHFTVTTAIVEGLDVLGVITADRVVARILSKYPHADPNSPVDASVEPSILATGSHIDNLVIAGHLVKVKLHVGTLCELDTFSKAIEHGPRRLGSAFYNHEPDPQKEREKGGTITCTLVDSIDIGEAPELHLRGRDSIFVDQFGTIKFGEVLIKQHERHVTMIQVQLGCGHEGRLFIAAAQGNGTGGGT